MKVRVIGLGEKAIPVVIDEMIDNESLPRWRKEWAEREGIDIIEKITSRDFKNKEDLLEWRKKQSNNKDDPRKNPR